MHEEAVSTACPETTEPTMATLLAVSLLVLLSTTTSWAAPTLQEHLKANGNTKFLQMLDTLGLKVDSSKITGTLLVPSDKAITAFAKSMQMTDQELLKHPDLVDLVVSYHFMPGYALKNTENVPANTNNGTLGISGDINYVWRVFRDSKSGRTWVQDAQNNNITLGKPTLVGKLAVIPVDTVLMSGGYFTNAEAALKHYPQWKAAYNFFKQHGSGVTLGNGVTMFVPDNAAFENNRKIISSLSAAAAADVLKNHIAKPAVQFPMSPKLSELATAMQGELKLEYRPGTLIQPWTRTKKVPVEFVTVVSESGARANVTIYNIHVGKDIFHGVNGLILPRNAAPAAKSPAAAAKPRSNNRRKLMQSWVGTHMPAYNAASMGYYQGYPSMFTRSNSASALQAASDGSVDNWGAGWDPYMAPQTGCFNCGFMM